MTEQEILEYIQKAQHAIKHNYQGHMIAVWQNGVDMAKTELEKRKQLR